MQHNLQSAPHFRRAATGKETRVLIVEDDPTARSALQQLLSAHGYQVVTVGSVAGALQVIPQGFDSLILDLMLPDGDGAEVLRRIRDLRLNTRVCVTTGVSNPAWLNQVKMLGADHILQKPIDVADLLEKL